MVTFVPPPLPSDDDERFMPRAEHAYERLVGSITSGQLPPGVRLREVELARDLGVSRTPVREALRRLELEGLANHRPGKGLCVTQLDADLIRELFAMREILEGAAAALAARHASAVEIATLKELADATDSTSIAATGRLPVEALDQTFRETLFRATHNRYLVKSLLALHTSLSLLPVSEKSADVIEEQTQRSARHRHRLVTAIAKRDALVAEQLARERVRIECEYQQNS